MAKVGFVLSGEGAKGSFQAGVIKNLETKGVVPEFISGSSSGSLTAAVYSYVGADKLIDLWKTKINKMGDVFRFQWDFFLKSGIFNTNPLKESLHKVITGEPTIPAVVTRVHNLTNEFQYVSNQTTDSKTFLEATLGAVAIPFLIEPVNNWVDGGAKELAPLKPAIDAGCDEIIVVIGIPPRPQIWDGVGVFQFCGLDFFKFAEIGYRFIDYLLFNVMINDLKKAHKKNGDPKYRKIKFRIFGPKERIGSPLDFSPETRDYRLGIALNNKYVEYFLDDLQDTPLQLKK